MDVSRTSLTSTASRFTKKEEKPSAKTPTTPAPKTGEEGTK